jgi:hypothetical protein
MSENELFSATVWDATKRDFVGLMSPLQLLLTVVHYRNELLPAGHAAPDYDYNASNALASLVANAVAAKPQSSLSMFSSSADDADTQFAHQQRRWRCGARNRRTAAGARRRQRCRHLDSAAATVQSVAGSVSSRRCVSTCRRRLRRCRRRSARRCSPSAPPSVASASSIPNDTLWDACRALLGALDSKLPLVDRDTQSVLCIVTMSRLLACLYNGLRPLPTLLTRSIDMLGVGSFINQPADRAARTRLASRSCQRRRRRHRHASRRRSAAHSPSWPSSRPARWCSSTTSIDQ